MTQDDSTFARIIEEHLDLKRKNSDLDGRMHTLSEHRGRKVLLVTWASW